MKNEKKYEKEKEHMIKEVIKRHMKRTYLEKLLLIY